MSSRYREHPPPAHLGNWVQCLWTLDSPAPEAGGHRVLPDGCIDILFETAGAGRSEIYVVGMMTRPLLVRRAHAWSITAVRFKPGAAAAFFREPLHRLTDARIELQELWPRSGALLARLSAAPTGRERIDLLTAELERRLSESPASSHAACRFAIRRLLQAPQTGVQELCSELGVSRQALARCFRDHVGIPPKTLGRVLRLQRTLQLLRSGAATRPPRWAELALDAGYYDQSHLIADFKELSGLTPSAFLAESRSGFPFFQDSAPERG
jgi:AraC-like DNA-binding protein